MAASTTWIQVLAPIGAAAMPATSAASAKPVTGPLSEPPVVHASAAAKDGPKPEDSKSTPGRLVSASELQSPSDEALRDKTTAAIKGAETPDFPIKRRVLNFRHVLTRAISLRVRSWIGNMRCLWPPAKSSMQPLRQN
jgi:hypothetical protein